MSTMILGCLDMQDVYIISEINTAQIPIIKHRSVLPSVGNGPISVNLGLGCESKDFVIPPLLASSSDTLSGNFYFLWFLNNQLLQKPKQLEIRKLYDAHISIKLNRSIIESFLGITLNDTFLAKGHKLEFFVSNKPYAIAENATPQNGAFGNYAYWNVKFEDTPCR